MSDQKEKSVARKNISSKKWSLFFTNIANIYVRKVPISRKNINSEISECNVKWWNQVITKMLLLLKALQENG